MARRRTFNRWSDADRSTLAALWPVKHEVEVWEALGRRYTMIAVRTQATKMGFRKTVDHREKNRLSIALVELQESRLRILELETAVKILRAQIRTLQRCAGSFGPPERP